MLETLAQVARVVQGGVSLILLGGIAIAYYSWQSKQNLDRRNLAIAYSLTKNRQYFDARGEIYSRFKSKFARSIPLTREEVLSLKENNDKIINDVKFVLSHWEIMAISIFDKIIDEKTCYEMVGATLVNTVDVLHEYVIDIRSQPQDARRYDYLLILHDEWRRRIDKTKAERSISRYQQYLDLGKDRTKFERRLASDRADW